MKKKVYKGRLSYLPAEGAGAEPEQVLIETQDPNAEETSSKSSEDSCEREKSSEEDSLPPRRYPAESNEQAEGPALARSLPTNLPPTDLLVPLDRPVPDTWKTKEGDFLSVSPIMIPCLSSDFLGDRELSIGSGNIRVMWVDGSITRRGVLSMLTSAESGKHTRMDEVYRIDSKAFRLEPITTPGIMTVDGEAVHYGPMQAQVHPQLARLMSRRRKS